MKRTGATDREAEASDAQAAQPPSAAPRMSRWRRARDNFWPSWTTRDMGFLLSARVCMSATRALAGVLVPIYLALIGYSGFALGTLFAVVALASAAMTALIGILSDRVGRKIFIVVIPWLAAAAALVFAFTRVGALIFIFAALGSFGRGAGAGAGTVGPYQPAEQALLADAVSSKHRNSLFGRIAFASSLGALIGSGPLSVLP
ncbi:MAG: MFS transporter, partial [Ktedonobacterales bacterium]